jgi:predicted nucleic acid-binding protein
MSAAEVFFDSNILIYLFSSETGKARRAEELLYEGGTVTIQVLNEVATVAWRKGNLDFPAVRHILSVVRASCRVRLVDLETHELGLDVAERYGFAIHDSMIVAAALRSGCRVLYSEDMHNGQKIKPHMTIRNPFRGSRE